MTDKSIDYSFFPKVKHLVRADESVVALIKTKSVCKKFFDNKNIAVFYYLLFTTKRVVIIANNFVNEYSSSYGYSELSGVKIVRGILKDKIKIKEMSFTVSKGSVKKIAGVNDYINIDVKIWKYPLFSAVILLILVGAFKSYHYFGIYKYFLSGPEASDVSARKKILKKKKPVTNIDASLNDITDGYEFAYNLILKHYPIYIKHPASTGDPSSSFDTWATNEVLSSLDAQDTKLSALSLNLQKHIMVKVELSDLRLLIMNLLDVCKKSFKKKKEALKIKGIKKQIEKKFLLIKKIML